MGILAGLWFSNLPPSSSAITALCGMSLQKGKHQFLLEVRYSSSAQFNFQADQQRSFYSVLSDLAMESSSVKPCSY
ncbi:hypothetical protein F5878DRAFT_625530 [Lentinula raphanica]|uniref:Secreted protein n=1 Tax=Lentinula raphanica TaxID=153919 RepID=A0AA38P501_9AGAR|nr:hypothetical protein F5878DRAFT_625530 [Lentinula raphanica]